MSRRKYRYKGYEITRKWVTTRGRRQPDEWVFSHLEYTGPEDNRIGSGQTLRDCIEQINEAIEP